MKNKSRLSPEKAAEMLRDGTAHGHALTGRQKKMLYAVKGGAKMKAGRKKRRK